MKIISNFKDYYDWCVSSRGVDPKVVYNRNSEPRLPDYSYNRWFPRERFNCVRFFIAGSVYDLLIDPKEKKVLCGQDALNALAIESIEKIYIAPEAIGFKNDGCWELFLTEPVPYNTFRGIYNNFNAIRPSYWSKGLPFKSNPNEHFDCPVIMTDTPSANNRLYMNVKLSDWNFGAIVDPEKMFDIVYNWLLQRQDKTIVDNRTDKEKIVSHGFDLKSSFRLGADGNCGEKGSQKIRRPKK
jgi:hypothetical protein